MNGNVIQNEPESWDLRLHALRDVPLINEGDDLGSIAVTALRRADVTFESGDVLVVAQKVVSKAEGRLIRLADVVPTDEASELAERTGRDAALCQLYLDESVAILGVTGRHVITLHRLGFEGTGAGVDLSNAVSGEDHVAVLLPINPDESARRIRETITDITGARVAVIVSDSFLSLIHISEPTRPY